MDMENKVQTSFYFIFALTNVQKIPILLAAPGVHQNLDENVLNTFENI
jgi:hypothetical protein